MSGRLEFVLGDLAREEVDAIVNPSNSGFMLSFAGVNGALLEAAGEELATECRSLGLAAEREVRAWLLYATHLSGATVRHSSNILITISSRSSDASGSSALTAQPS